MSHRAHPVNGDPTYAILFDDCEGCERHANGGGLTLDSTMLARSWNRMLDVERGSRTGTARVDSYQTGAEAKLCGRLYEMALLMERHPGLRMNPWLRMDAEDD
jgi:hypothetical protein